MSSHECLESNGTNKFVMFVSNVWVKHRGLTQFSEAYVATKTHMYHRVSSDSPEESECNYLNNKGSDILLSVTKNKTLPSKQWQLTLKRNVSMLIPSLLLVQKLEISNGIVSHKARKNDLLFSFFYSHGTRCAGEVAALANNTICGSGVAYHAHVGGMIFFYFFQK